MSWLNRILKRERISAPEAATLARPEGGGTVLRHPPTLAAAPPSLAREIREGSRVADVFLIKRTLGAGGMGVVYLAHHEQWDLDVALKAVHPEHVTKAEYRHVFIREAQAWTDLGLHPHIAYCYYVQQLNEDMLLVAEYPTVAICRTGSPLVDAPTSKWALSWRSRRVTAWSTRTRVGWSTAMSSRRTSCSPEMAC